MTHATLWRSIRTTIAALPLMLAACGGSDDAASPPAVGPTVASIVVVPTDADVGIGLSRIVTAEARDQTGAVMTGVDFTWSSSDAGVATVASGRATGVAAGTAAITASSGGVVSNAVRLTVTPVSASSVAIDKPSVFLTASGQSAQLTARITDAQGVPAAGDVTWVSSAPDKVSVDASGLVLARAVGSALIVAEVGGLRSAPTLAIVAVPMPGAVLVTDAQVVTVGPPLGGAAGTPGAVGGEYEVTLTGVAAPAPGTIVLGAETAPVAGKVVSTRQEAAGLVVRLSLEPLYRLFSAYDIHLDIALSGFGIEAMPSRAAAQSLGAVWGAGKRSRALALPGIRPLDALAPFQTFDCDLGIKPQLAAAPINLAFENKLSIVLIDRPGYSKHALEGSAELVGNAGLTLKAGFKGGGRCDAQAQVKMPVLGWFSALVMPAIRFGLGVDIESEVLLVQGELGVEGRVGISPVLGWECGGATPACRGLDSFTPTDNFKTKSKIPSEHDMQAKVSAHFYVVAGLDATFFLGVLNAGIVEGRVGPKQSFDLAFEEDQAARPDYAASYDLKLEGIVEPGAALKKAIEKVIGDDSTTVKFSFELHQDISESPTGSLRISESKVRPNSPVDFTVTLAPSSSMEYFLIGYNVVDVELYRRSEGETNFVPWKVMTQVASNTFTYRWVPAAADAGKHEFAAFVNTKIPVPLLEVAKDSVRELEVSCFPGPPGALGRTGRAGIQAASTNGTHARPQATACFDSFAGTSTYILKTPGLPAANFTSRASITWTLDPSQEGVVYKASGSFDLAINHADSCTSKLSPNTFVIADEPPTPTNPTDPTKPISLARLAIFDHVNPKTYAVGGAQYVDTTVTVSCPGRSDVVSRLNGFLVIYADGSGPYQDGQATLSGSIEDASKTSTWSFSRP